MTIKRFTAPDFLHVAVAMFSSSSPHRLLYDRSGYGYFAEFRVHLWSGRCLGTWMCVFSCLSLTCWILHSPLARTIKLDMQHSWLLIVDTVAPYADIESDRAWDKATYLMIPRKLLPCFLLLALKLGRCSHVCNHDYDALAPQLASHKACCFADWKKKLAH